MNPTIIAYFGDYELSFLENGKYKDIYSEGIDITGDFIDKEIQRLTCQHKNIIYIDYVDSKSQEIIFIKNWFIYIFTINKYHK